MDLFVIYAEVKEGMLFNESRSTQKIDAANFDQQKFLNDVQSILENQPVSEGAQFIVIRLVEADLDIASRLNELLRNEGYPEARECLYLRKPVPQSHEDMLEWIEKSMREETKKSAG